MLLDAWGEEFLAHGEIDLRFVGMVVAGDTVEARVEIDDSGTATIEVVNTTAGTTSVAGSATRAEPGSRRIHRNHARSTACACRPSKAEGSSNL